MSFAEALREKVDTILEIHPARAGMCDCHLTGRDEFDNYNGAFCGFYTDNAGVKRAFVEVCLECGKRKVQSLPESDVTRLYATVLQWQIRDPHESCIR